MPPEIACGLRVRAATVSGAPDLDTTVSVSHEPQVRSSLDKRMKRPGFRRHFPAHQFDGLPASGM
ncbi:hypothetical protein V2S85_25875 [Novosphingobium resinovorum]|nr:hypothetical protein [Novosphingobium resinovorum]